MGDQLSGKSFVLMGDYSGCNGGADADHLGRPIVPGFYYLLERRETKGGSFVCAEVVDGPFTYDSIDSRVSPEMVDSLNNEE